MIRRYTLILNVFLIVTSLLIGVRVYKIWSEGDDQQAPPVSVKESQPSLAVPAMGQARQLPRKAFDVIVQKDLFRPERTEWIVPQAEAAGLTGPATPPKQLIVYGIVLADDLKQAWVLEEGSRDKPKMVAEGDALEDWTVSKIDAYSVSISRGNDTATFNLVEPGKPKARIVPRVANQPRMPPQHRPTSPLPAPRPRPSPLKPNVYQKR